MWIAPQNTAGWTAYHNSSGKSGVREYRIGAESIAVRFKSGAAYTYTHSSCGADVVGLMKTLARSGRGLSTYIARNKPGYASRG